MAMEQSILKSTKEVLGLVGDDTGFDLSIMTFINTAFSTLHQLGITSPQAFTIEDDTALWEDLALDADQLSNVKSYIFLKAQSYWDPPTTSYLLESRSKQILELEVRISTRREEVLYAQQLADAD